MPRPDLSEAALRSLEQQLDRASLAAEELIAEAAARAIGKPPPAGWQQPGAGGEGDARGSNDTGPGDGRRGDARRSDVELALEVLGALRERIPPELQRRLGEALREVLLALRALIDWYLERSERGRTEPAEVHDIPIL